MVNSSDGNVTLEYDHLCDFSHEGIRVHHCRRYDEQQRATVSLCWTSGTEEQDRRLCTVSLRLRAPHS
jgi:hypothetical protein